MAASSETKLLAQAHAFINTARQGRFGHALFAAFCRAVIGRPGRKAGKLPGAVLSLFWLRRLGASRSRRAVHNLLPPTYRAADAQDCPAARRKLPPRIEVIASPG